MLRQIVGNLKPGGFARHEEVAFGPHAWIVIETTKSNSEFRRAIGAVYNWRTTDAAKPAMESRRRFKVFDQLFALHPPEIIDEDAGTAAKGRPVSLSAL